MSLLSALRSTINSFDVLARQVDVAQNNIANASTPGFVQQRLGTYARPFEAGTLSGGVAAGTLDSARDVYIERSVRRALESHGRLQESKAQLADLESNFDVSGKAGAGTALNNLFASFSNWSVHPGDRNVRNNVLAAADQFARDVRATASGVNAQAASVAQQTRETVSQINQIVGELRTLNEHRKQLGQADPSTDARVFELLEQLSTKVNFDSFMAEDGTVNVSLGGTPLLTSDRQIKLELSFSHDADPVNPAALPSAHIRAGEREITDEIRGGKLASELDFRNRVVPGLIGSGSDEGSLNRFARSVAQRVNQIFENAGGSPLFTYDSSNITASAGSLALNGSLDADDLVAGTSVSNGVPLALTALSQSVSPGDGVDGFTYGQFFAHIATGVGTELAATSRSLEVQGAVVTQVQSIRSSVSGISLDEEAVQLVALQRSYEATARVAQVLNDLTEVAISILR